METDQTTTQTSRPPVEGARGFRPSGVVPALPAGVGRGLILWVILIALFLPGLAAADPVYTGPLLYGLDPVVKITEDPRLLGTDRLVLLRRLKVLGVDPRDPVRNRPGLKSSFRRIFNEKSRIDLMRREFLIEYNGLTGLVTEIRYPKFFFLFPSSETLPGGFTYYPPRPLQDPLVDLFVDDIELASLRRHRVDQIISRTEKLDLVGAGRTKQGDTSLINLTIPIKLPRTLEKIIGRGEKTRIKISGREHISLSGESTVTKPFVGSERVQSQSLFPSLDMQQQLQVNLSGTIGEKIIIEVDHNSEAIGPEGTKIKLMYQGLEDEVISTIESGDVGLTLPGSQLLGYSSNKSGLFGIKVTGQVGRADFTAVASKQKAESSSKNFNAKGGQVEDRVILSSDYLNNRFFQLDLPLQEDRGRLAGEKIDLSSVKIYKRMGSGLPILGDINNVAAYVDDQGLRAWNETDIDFSEPYIYGTRWREITTFDTLVDQGNNLIAVDMRSRMLDEDVLAVVYNVVDAESDEILFKVGDRPGDVIPEQNINEGGDGFYRMKLLKAPLNNNNPHLFNYVLRNIYSLGGANIDPTTFDLRIESTNPRTDQPQLDEMGNDYILLFGLDRENPQRTGGPDGRVDSHDQFLFDLQKGLLKFPLDFPTPFNAGEAAYAAYAAASDSAEFAWEGSFLADNQAPNLYDPDTLPSDYNQSAFFKLVATHASASGNINLGVSNIEEGSETVTVDGRTLTNGVDYEIDYTFGEVKLIGDAANLSPDSQIGVNYQYAPFFGGGKTSLMGLNLGYDLGRSSKLTTTWLYQTEAIVGEKAKLGEEPSKTLVGNVNFNNTFKPYLLTHMANFLTLQDSERESSLQITGEVAASLPNPNTKGRVFLEDFEGVDSSNFVSLNRLGWSWASAPFLGFGYVQSTADSRSFDPEDRVETVRWFLPRERVLRRYLNPELINQERDETQNSMDLFLRADDGVWDDEDWGGIMRGISRTGIDLAKSQFIEIWVNDGKPDLLDRSGKLHIDFGYINEDGFWPRDQNDQLIVGQFEQEDGVVPGTDPDFVWTYEEDIGLDGNENGPQRFSAEYEIGGDSPFPQINGTSRNNREDTEDLNGNTQPDRDNGFFTATIDLAETEALVDVVYDYDDVQELFDGKIAWRKYRIPIGEVDSVSVGTVANIKAITHARIWYENDSPDAPAEVRLQLSEFKFLGSRWEREGIRRISDESLLTEPERRGGEFFLGEVNNKENPDYFSPFTVNKINNIPEKEQSLVLNYNELQQGQMIRTSKQVSPRGDDYTRYRVLSWFWFNPDHRQADLDLFFRVGADTLNYYEVEYRFSESEFKTGWQGMTIGVAELSNVKNGELGEDGVVRGTVVDQLTGQTYRASVVGRPDLRTVKRYYFGIKNPDLSEEASGYFYFNDIKLEDVKKESGMAQRAGLRLNMADVIKVDFDWKRTDAEFHGLNSRAGSGIQDEDWNVSTNFNLNNFLPLGGFRIPVNASRRQTIKRPKYEINSDIEILDEDVRNMMSTVDTSERFSTRLSHSPSKAAIPRYLVDPWTALVSGSRSRADGPLQLRRQKSLQGSLNYDLRISGNYNLYKIPLLGKVPMLRGLSLIPKKVAFGANFTSSANSSASIDDAGNVIQRPQVTTRPGNLTGSLDYKPTAFLNLSFNAKSERDLLRENERFGINIGEENKRSYDLNMTITVPKPTQLPEGTFFWPLRQFSYGLNKLRPSMQFTGSFADQHDPAVRQAGDPLDVKNVSNNGNWEVRFDVPMGDIFKSVFPERKFSQPERERLLAEQRRLERQGGRGGEQGEGAIPPQDLGNLTPEERLRLEEERLLEEAQARREAEEERTQGSTEPPATDEAGSNINPFAIFDPFLDALRNTNSVKFTLSNRKISSYTRFREPVPFWYVAGFENTLDIPDSSFAGSSFQERQNITMSTATKVRKNIGLDFKYGLNTSTRDMVGSQTKNYKQDWPDVQMSLSGIEKWPMFGRNPDDINSGWFRTSTINVSYKRSKTVNNFTPVNYNPNVTTSISPRWSFNFHSGMSATLTSNISRDRSDLNGITTNANKMRIGLQFRHQFRAQSFLAKLGLYRPGSNPTVNMDVDISYQRDRTERVNPGGSPVAPTGTTRYSFNPRFSYQVTRNLNGAVRLLFNRNNNVATDQTTTSLGLGVEATFVF